MTIKYCRQCVLPENFPGVQFDHEGVCQYCRESAATDKRRDWQERARGRFETLVDAVRSEPGYQCMVSWSGGKDSTYTLWLMRERYGLRVLAFTFDNGFVSPAAFDNMRTVSDRLGVDHVIIKPAFSFLRQVFTASMAPGMYPSKALERASSICTTCMGLAKGIGLRLALEKEIPMMAFGWSPGQIPIASAFMRHPRAMLASMIETAAAPLVASSDRHAAVYFPEAHHFDAASVMPVNVSPLVFLDWDEVSAVDTIRQLGWTKPDDTDPNSTNCLLNALANQVHLAQTGYHAYAMELAGLVREGYLDRSEALGRMQEPPSKQAVAQVAARLGVDPPALCPDACRDDPV